MLATGIAVAGLLKLNVTGSHYHHHRQPNWRSPCTQLPWVLSETGTLRSANL
jgi:hypothetical protein